MGESKTVEAGKIEVSSLMTLVTSASRLMTVLTRAEPFKDYEIGIAEWLALSLLIERDAASNKQLAKSMGVSEQRINQICTSLSKSGLITIEQAPEDNRRNVLKVTPKGKNLLKSLNEKLQSFLENSLKDREKSLKLAATHLRILARRLQPVPISKPGDNQEKAGGK